MSNRRSFLVALSFTLLALGFLVTAVVLHSQGDRAELGSLLLPRAIDGAIASYSGDGSTGSSKIATHATASSKGRSYRILCGLSSLAGLACALAALIGVIVLADKCEPLSWLRTPGLLLLGAILGVLGFTVAVGLVM